MQKHFGSILSFNVYVENINTIHSTTQRIFFLWKRYHVGEKKQNRKKPLKNKTIKIHHLPVCSVQKDEFNN